MKTLGNLLWVIFGGLLLAIGWFIAGLLWCCTVIGIPVGLQCFKIASLVLWPFGKTVVYGEKASSFFLNIIWIILCGWELASGALVCGLLWCCTIVGIPFGLQFIKFAQLALFPFGAKVE